MIKGILFDKDGTLLEYADFWLPVARKAVEDMLKVRGVEPALLAPMLEAIGADQGISGVLCHGTYGAIAEALNSVLLSAYPNATPITGEENAATVAKYLSCGVLHPTCPDIVNVFDALQKRGLKLALATSDNTPIARDCLASLGILSYFDAIYADDGLLPPKPDPYFIHQFCKDFQFTPDEVMMVGDTVSDMRFALSGGAHPIGVAKTEQDQQLIAPYAEQVLHDISRLTDILP